MQAHTLSDTCRTCLTTDDSFLPLFTSDHHLQKTHFKSLAQCIMAFTDIYMSRDDGLPGQVCATCARKAVELHNFRRQCINNDKILRNTFKPTEVKPEVALDIEVTEKEECCLFEPEEDDNDELEEDLQITFEANTITDTPTDIVEETVENIYLDEIETLPSAEMLVLQEEGEKGDQDESPQIEDEACEKVECVLNAEEEKTNLKCPMCEKIFTQQTEFDSHLNSHMNKKNQCTICAKAFTKPSHLTRHLYTHEPVKPYNCKQCNKGFARLQQYTNHVNMHTGVKPHMCKQCGKGFNQISNLKDHMRTHNGEKPFLCSVCGKGFNQLGNLRQHTIRHSGVKAHLCTICGTGFASKGELGAHTRKHTGAKPFVCNICNHGFTTSSSLTKHKRIHSGEKPYECEVCKMRFSRSGILSRHKRTHTGEKPYACPHCTRAFAQSNDLASHLRIHTGERPFVCDVCGQAFRQTSALKTHKKVHRNRDAPPKTEREPAGIGVGVVKKEMAVANGAVL